MGNRTDRALVAGNLGIVSVDVNRLGKSGESDQQNTQQGHKFCVRFSRGFVFSDRQAQRYPHPDYFRYITVRRTMHTLVAQLSI